MHVCAVCGDSFTGYKQRTCPKCKNEAGRPLAKLKCVVCGKESIGVAGRQNTCSDDCRLEQTKRKAIDRKQQRAAVRLQKQKEWHARGSVVFASGDVAESMFDVLAARRRWIVAIPKQATCSMDYDRVVCRGSAWERVQIKSVLAGASQHAGKVQIKRTGGRQYGADACDLLAAVDTDTGDVWLIPWTDAVQKRWCDVRKYSLFRTNIMDE